MPMPLASHLRAIPGLFRTGALDREYGGLIDARPHPVEPLVLLNYSLACRYRQVWNEVTCWCRGLVIDTREWTLAAVPFPKFFGLNQRPETRLEMLPDESFTVFDKLDGSLGVSYRVTDGVALATRGAFDSREALCGTAALRGLKGAGEMCPGHTFLFEILDGTVRRRAAEVVLLGVVHRETGRDLDWPEVEAWAARIGCRTPEVHSFADLNEVLEAVRALPSSREGYVVRFASGLRVKVKGSAYLAARSAG
jgi:RNA ligase